MPAREVSRAVTYEVGGLSTGWARRALSYIAGNLGSKIRIAEISGVAGLSRSYFCRGFKLTQCLADGLCFTHAY
jgi:AraC-like DNA-binding protein